jgi:hypothetical protein
MTGKTAVMSVLARLSRGVEPITTRLDKIRCSFCGHDRNTVRRLVAGPSVYICDGCVLEATRIIEESDSATAETGDS